jgi:hypothetical protein
MSFEGSESMPADAVGPSSVQLANVSSNSSSRTHNLDWMLLTKRPENVIGYAFPFVGKLAARSSANQFT